MSVYKIPVWKMLEEVKNELPEVFKRQDVVNIIHKKFGSDVKESTIQAHVTACSDHPSSKHYAVSKHRIFRFLGNGKFSVDGNYTSINDLSPEEDLIQDVEENEIETPIETTFTLERDLEEFLYRNLEQLEEGLKPHPEGISRQYSIDVGRMDILAIDKNEDLVVIELKAGRAPEQVVSQILGYMAWVRENIAENKKVRGIIVANSFPTRVKYAVSEIPNLLLKEYTINFSFNVPDK